MNVEPADILSRISLIQSALIDPLTNQPLVTYENVPYTISVADMPLFVNYAGNLLEHKLISNDVKGRDFNDVRNYNMVLYYSPYGAGVEEEKMGLLTPYLESVHNQFGSYPHLKALPGVLSSDITSDSGMSIVEFLGTKYFGIRFTLRVVTKVRRLLSIED
jgi:hypothetical protein